VDNITDKVVFDFEVLEAPSPEDWVETEAEAASFSPSVAQWNLLVRQVEALTHKLSSAQEAVAVLADVSESRFEVVDGQVNSLCCSGRILSSELGSNLPALNPCVERNLFVRSPHCCFITIV
jgi:hypothetical protein